MGDILFAGGGFSPPPGSNSLFHLPLTLFEMVVLVLLLLPLLLFPELLKLFVPPVLQLVLLPRPPPPPPPNFLSDMGIPKTGEKAPPERRAKAESGAAVDVSTEAIVVMPDGLKRHAFQTRFRLLNLRDREKDRRRQRDWGDADRGRVCLG